MTEAEIAEVRRQLEALGWERNRQRRYRNTTVVLDRQELAALDEVAAAEGRSRSWLIREAIRRTWLRGRNRRPAGPRADAGRRRRTPEEDAEWRQRLAALEARVASRIPAGTTPAELEAEITAAREEVRQERGAARGR